MFHCIIHSEYDTLIQETVDVTLPWDDDIQIEARKCMMNDDLKDEL